MEDSTISQPIGPHYSCGQTRQDFGLTNYLPFLAANRQELEQTRTNIGAKVFEGFVFGVVQASAVTRGDTALRF